MATITFTKKATAKRGTSTYIGEGLVIYLPKSVKTHPESFSTSGLEPNPVAAAKPKETAEERKARLDAQTPEQKLEAARKRTEAARKKEEALAAQLTAKPAGAVA